MFISNGAYAPSSMQKTWNFNGYHQLVVWPWQEYLMTKGIDNQLQRQDLKQETRRELKRAELALWKLIYKTASYSGIELYGADAHDGELEPSAYGQSEENKTSSAIIQGWSKLAMFVQPPQRVLQLIGNPPEPSEKARYFYSSNSSQPQPTDLNNRPLRQPAGNLSPHF
jgi:glycogen debranching enzyme